MKGKLQYFNIEKLGIYLRGSSEHLFINSDEAILDSLISWFHGRPQIINTGTRKADKSKGQSNVYCYDVDGSNGEYVFVLWNEVTNAEGEILTLSKQSKPGDAIVKSGLDSTKSIPGLPSYYWISLNHNLVVTLHFDHALSSLVALRDYITGYIQNYSEFAVTDEENENKVIGYRKPNDVGSMGYFKFDIKRKIDESTVQELSQKHNLITKVVRRTKKAVEDVEYQGFFHNLASKVIQRGLPSDREVCVDIELEFTPKSEADFKEIVRAYRTEILDPDRHNNLGFVLRGNGSRPLFLDGQSLRSEHNFELIRDNKKPLNAAELLEYIVRKQVRFVPRSNSREAA